MTVRMGISINVFYFYFTHGHPKFSTGVRVEFEWSKQNQISDAVIGGLGEL